MGGRAPVETADPAGCGEGAQGRWSRRPCQGARGLQGWRGDHQPQRGVHRQRVPAEVDDGEIEAQEGPDEVYDESGNKIDVKKNKPMDAKDIKKAIKDVEKKLKDHKKKNNLSEEEAWELEDKLTELKTALEGQTK